jgi:UDP-N-acetyl-D-mannosaminuronic acid dehydrogenase
MEKQKIVVLGGCGHVGLPLAIHLAIVGYESVVVDINQSAVGKVNGGEYPFVESRGDRYLAVALAQGFRATTNIEEMKNANVIVIITGMDVGKTHIS